MSESGIQAKVLLRASQEGMRLWRNNVGALQDATGRYVRYGLANDTPKLNKVFKSSDLIGLRTVTITQDMVGKAIGQFVALEVKKEGWTYKGTDHEKAQKAFIDFINGMGGYAAFCNGEGEIIR
jgi:hypothetical protein